MSEKALPSNQTFDCVIVGAGFTGLSAAIELSRLGHKVALVEQASKLGGLAGTFQFSDGVELEKFYHHWFTSDRHIMEMIREVGLEDDVIWNDSHTASFFNQRIWRLSSPLDLLRFKELSVFERIRLGLVAIYVRSIRDFLSIEGKSIRDWLEPLVGKRVFDKVWRPLIDAKFGDYSEQVSAAWMWKKLVLRGASRRRGGFESLGYMKGGFGRLAREIKHFLEDSGVTIFTSQTVESLVVKGEKAVRVETSHASFSGRSFILTIPQPSARNLLINACPEKMSLVGPEIPHLSNICLVLRLKRSLSTTYWLNVSDPGFPFVGVIEHTNLDRADVYGGDSIVYLSRYLSPSDKVWKLSDGEYFDYAVPHLSKMFPAFDESWVREWSVWRSRYAQPVTTINYSKQVPPMVTPIGNVFSANMAQIYPEDRGTNYAVLGGRQVALKADFFLKGSFSESNPNSLSKSA